jgi:hypothetical protein
MEEITQKLKKIMKLRNNKTVIYKKSNMKSSSLFVDALSDK